MPSADARPPEGSVIGARKAKISREDEDDLNAINASIDRMRSFIGADPYVMTIPQDVEPRYHHGYQFQAMQWLLNTPFKYSEGEWMQYQTFFYHEHGRDMHVLHNSRPRDEREEPVVKVKTVDGADTPNAGPKKKISLDAYKKKQTGGTPAPPEEPEKPEKPEKQDSAVLNRQPAIKGPVERIKAETEEVLAAAAEADEIPLEDEKKGLKRKREESGAQQKHQDESNRPSLEDQSAPKKVRTTSPPPTATHPDPAAIQSESAKFPAEAKVAERVNEKNPESGMPPKLSPLQVPALPSRLSPTIPPNIADTLKARVQFRSSSSDGSAPNSASKNGKLTPIKEVDVVVKRKSPVPRNGFRANSSSPAVRSDAEERGRPITSAPQRLNTPELSQEEEIVVAKAVKVAKQREPSLLVKLKYKKHHRDAIRRILNTRPKPEKSATPQPAASAAVTHIRPDRPVVKSTRDRRDTNAKGVAQKIGPAPSSFAKKADDSKRTAEKRPASTDIGSPESPAKKQRKESLAVETKRDPSTPMQPDFQSPSQLSSTQKSQQITPSIRKDHLSIAMQREPSSESHKMKTPTAQSTTPVTIGHASQPNGLPKPPSSQPNNKTPMQQAWEMEQRRLETLGRELKHAATAHLKSLSVSHSDPAGPSSEQKLAAIKSVESLLAYFLAFTSADEAALAADPKQSPSTKPWRSLHAFFAFVRRNCESFPLLLGLACALGVVFNAHILNITCQHPAEGPSRDTLIETYGMLQRAAVEADETLDVDRMRDAFPRAWKQRSNGTLPNEKVIPGEFGGFYKLPLSVQTPPLQAARAGFAMLEEQILKESVGYQLKLRL